MFVFQIQKDSLAVKKEKIIDSIQGYRELRESISLAMKWSGSVLDKTISNELYYTSKKELRSESEQLSGLLKQSVYRDTKFEVAVAYLDNMASMLRKGENVNEDLPSFKKQLMDLDKILNEMIRGLEKVESEFMKKTDKKKVEAKVKTYKAPKKTMPKQTKYEQPFKSLVDGVKDGQAKKDLVMCINNIAVENNMSKDQVYQAIEYYNRIPPRGAESGDAAAVEKLNAYIKWAETNIKKQPKK